MKYLSYRMIAVSLIGVSGMASAEIITGVFSEEQIDFPETPQGGFVDELGLSFQGLSEFSGSSFFNYYLVGSAESPQQSLQYLRSGNDGGILPPRDDFLEGQSLSTASSETSRFFMGLSSGGFGGDPVNYDLLGDTGETIYIGFVVETMLGGSVENNYGFLQLEKGIDLDYRVSGWAYQTEADTELVVFNIPTPSSILVFGLCGIGVTRRRRA